MNVQRSIEAPREIRLKVAKQLGITESSLNHAMNYNRHGEQSRRARELVLASGEARIMNYLPECETIHTWDGKMRQVFANGNILIIEMETGNYRVYSEDKEVEGKERMKGKIDTIPSLLQLQSIVENHKL